MNLHIRNMLEAQGDHLSFHTPGHKRAGEDITELSYSDNLLSPTGVIAAAERDAAEILGAAHTFFLTDGSTCGIFSMLYALKAAGVKSIAVPEYSHRSVRNACLVLGIGMVLIPQKVRFGIPMPAAVKDIEQGVEEADALLLTSPDYYGFISSVGNAREICTRFNKPFVIDGAHGSHLHFTNLYAGKYADMWVDGLHKSLPALTQGAAVSARTEEWGRLLQRGVRTFRTTSPSYPILASVEEAIKYPRNEKIEQLSEALKPRLCAVRNHDWSKLVLPFGRYAGEAQQFLEKNGVYPEFNDGNYLMFYLSPCTREEDLYMLERLIEKLPRELPRENVPAGIIPIYSEE